MVITVNGVLSEAAAERMRRSVEAGFPGIKCLVLEDGASVQMLADAPAQPHTAPAGIPAVAILSRGVTTNWM